MPSFQEGLADHADPLYGVVRWETVTNPPGAVYTIDSGDYGKALRISNAIDVTVTMPNSAPLGTFVSFQQAAAGELIFKDEAAAAVRSAQSHTKTLGQHAIVLLQVTEIVSSVAKWTMTGQTV